MKRKDRLILLAIVIGLWAMLIGVFAAADLSGKDYSLHKTEYNHLIGASYMTMNNEFYKILSEEIIQRVEAEGDHLILRDPALSVERQTEQIESMLDMGIDVLVLTPVDWESLNEVLHRAREQGVYIVVVDSNVKDETLADCTITSDNYAAGHMVGEYFLSQHQTGKFLVMTHETAKSGRDRVQGFLDAVEGCAGIEIVKKIECEGQLEIAMPKMKEAIDSGLEFDQVFCLNDLTSVGVAAALDEYHMLDQVGVYGVDASPDSKALIKEGMMQATAAQFPSRIGQAAADNIYRLLDGEPIEKNIRIPVDLVVKENVDLYSVDRWQ